MSTTNIIGAVLGLVVIFLSFRSQWLHNATFSYRPGTWQAAWRSPVWCFVASVLLTPPAYILLFWN